MWGGGWNNPQLTSHKAQGSTRAMVMSVISHKYGWRSKENTPRMDSQGCNWHHVTQLLNQNDQLFEIISWFQFKFESSFENWPYNLKAAVLEPKKSAIKNKKRCCVFSSINRWNNMDVRFKELWLFQVSISINKSVGVSLQFGDVFEIFHGWLNSSVLQKCPVDPM